MKVLKIHKIYDSQERAPYGSYVLKIKVLWISFMIGLICIVYIYSPMDIRKEHKAEIAHVHTVTMLLYTCGMLNNTLNAASMLVLNVKLLPYGMKILH